jgi:hypothetical protein
VPHCAKYVNRPASVETHLRERARVRIVAGMRCLLAALLLVACSSSTAGTEPPLGGAGGAEAPSGGRDGEANTGGQPVAGQGGNGGSVSSASGTGGAPRGEGGIASTVAGAAGADPSTAGEAGAAGVMDVPGDLFASCDTAPVFCQPEWTCGAWVPAAGEPAAHLCSFQCWSLQTLGGSHTPALAPDAALIAKCAALGGVCNTSAGGGFVPVCAPY